MHEHRWLILRLEAPLVAFGGVTIDQVGVTRAFPAQSFLTGLLANALGWRRTEWEKHQHLQDRLIFAARRDRENDSGILTDVQNAQIAKSDTGWTTRGAPERRDGDSYGAPHRRQREYHPDACVTLALRLLPAESGPDLDALADALDRPARPLFIGRKPCLPSAPLWQGEWLAAPIAHAALQGASSPDDAAVSCHALWPANEGPSDGLLVDRIIDLPDLRNWRTGLHGGTRRVVIGRIQRQGVAA